MNVEVTKYDKFSWQSVTIFQKIRELTEKERIGELVSLAGWRSVEAEKMDVLRNCEVSSTSSKVLKGKVVLTL